MSRPFHRSPDDGDNIRPRAHVEDETIRRPAEDTEIIVYTFYGGAGYVFWGLGND
jgi:hypothetical protein